ncbi:MAG: aminotransferase class V-fold PLP-dependent enzyme [Phycisphaerae bacterium]|nr:aminotransferase class V-fold PLP-dependent enzyme [Phycisphaerae bacterium]MCZ2398465.1 aminotransferase class V-fold PLP-dependent enzyme [Phycisphaerae bacterium]NUQ50535.1 aminotransferase class V-fold PLP-dependent enzyme [Phycisphaerae bacterium]
MRIVGPSRRGFLRGAAAVGALGGWFLRADGLEHVAAAQRRAGDRPAEELARDEDFWIEIQQAFAVDRSIINLNNGGVSPSPRVVQEALRRHLEYANTAPARHLWAVQDPQVETVRAGLARAFGCEAEELAITRNASEALETCIFGMDLRAGDEVLTSEHDYPRMINAYRQRERRDGIRLVLAPLDVPLQDPADAVQAFRERITPRTKVMLVSHVVFVTGEILPVRELCALGREHGIPVIVDGAHAFAHIAFKRDDLGCDYYGTSLHKWLTAPHGTGFLSVRKDKIAGLWPLMAAPEPRSDSIRKFEEIGTHPAANYLAVAEALTLHNAIGPRRKEARLRYLRDRWARRLAEDKRVHFATRLDAEHGCGIATMRLDGVDHEKLVGHLWSRHRIMTTGIDYANVRGLRVTPNVYTTLEEIDVFSRAIEDVLADGLPASSTAPTP